MLPRRSAAPWLLSYVLVGGTIVTEGCVAVALVCFVVLSVGSYHRVGDLR